MFSGADVNVGSKERELHRLLEVLRIKAEIHVLVHFSFLPPTFSQSNNFLSPEVWDHVSSLLSADPSGGFGHEVDSCSVF